MKMTNFTNQLRTMKSLLEILQAYFLKHPSFLVCAYEKESVCACPCVFRCVCLCGFVCITCIHRHAYVYGGQRTTSGVIFWDWVSHRPGVHQVGQSGWPLSPKDLHVSASPAQSLQAFAAMPGLLHNFWRWNSGSPVWETSTLPTELSFQPR